MVLRALGIACGVLSGGADFATTDCAGGSCHQEPEAAFLLQGASRSENASVKTLFVDAPPLRVPPRETRAKDVLKADSSSYQCQLFRELGCWPLDPSDDRARPDARFHDESCASYRGTGRCRSGLPFFRFGMPEGADSRECSRFCLSKGLDLSGILDIDKRGFECRCGASRGNAGAWRRVPPRQSNLLDLKGKVEKASPECKMLVFRYQGHLENGAVPTKHTGVNENDRSYMDFIVRGVWPNDDAEDSNEVHKANALGVTGHQKHEIADRLSAEERTSIQAKEATARTLLERQRSLLQSNDTGQANMMCADDPHPFFLIQGRKHSCPALLMLCRRGDDIGTRVKAACPFTCSLCSERDKWSPCFPDNCGTGSPWLTQDVDGTFEIPYVFDPGVDYVRRDAFVEATKAWEDGTCIRFKQGGSVPRIRVVIEDFSTCYSEVGYPGPHGETKINLGSCNSHRTIGNMMHELGHAIGMAHEHRRPDAGARIWLADEQRYVGPYLIFHWENIPVNVRQQYVPDLQAYTGSDRQGRGDVHDGYSEYDYGSIMHYPRMNNRFEAAQNSAYNNLMGQRDYPSSNDYKQVKDMYQCGGETRHTSRSEYERDSLWYWLGYDEAEISRWTAGVFGKCKIRGGEEDTCYRSRSVHCVGLHGEEIPESSCTLAKKPEEREPCSCSNACVDQLHTGIHQGDVEMGCWQLSHHCYDAEVAPAVRKACPATCDLCSTIRSSGVSCTDMKPSSLIKKHGTNEYLTCDELAAQGACRSELGPTVQFRCPESCGICPTHSEADVCEDKDSFRDDTGYGCLAYIGYDCPSMIRSVCPRSCGMCED